MRGYLSPLLVSISLAVINEAAQSKTPVQDVLRNKRSFVTDSVHTYHQGSTGYKKLQKSPSHGQHKRDGFDTLDLDALFEDPIFAEMMAEEETGLSGAKDNHLSFDLPEFEPEPLFPKHPVQSARQPFHPIRPFHAAPNPYHMPRPIHKDEMSNVIPGALGPMDDEPRGGRVQELTGQMLEEFLWFLELKGKVE